MLKHMARSSQLWVALALAVQGLAGACAPDGDQRDEDAAAEVVGAPLPLGGRIRLIEGYGDYAHFTGETWPASPRWPTVLSFGSHWRATVAEFDIISGVTRDAAFVSALRRQGKLFSYHVDESFTGERDVLMANAELDPHSSGQAAFIRVAVRELVAKWSAPFEDTLGGALEGGFDSITIDELHSTDWDGSVRSAIIRQALRTVRARYPEKRILVYAVATLAASGTSEIHPSINPDARSYSQVLAAVGAYANLLIVENYQTPQNQHPSFFGALAENLNRVNHSLLDKTIYALLIQTDLLQQTCPSALSCASFVRGFLSREVLAIKDNPAASRMPGIGFWVFYRSDPATVRSMISVAAGY
jgi:hypothetical protein